MQPSNSGPGQSTIRLMTRIAIEYDAVNLSQGFPNEPPPRPVVEALARATLAGTTESASMSLSSLFECDKKIDGQNNLDELNQYSMPMGRPSLRKAVAKFYERVYEWGGLDPETQITITCGATEAVGSALRSLGKPGDKIGFFEPFHELYPSQCKLFYLEPTYVTLTQTKQTSNVEGEGAESDWTFDWEQLENAIKESTAFILNSPHNPTGKVFTYSELSRIARLALKHDTFIITDEIYEFMCYKKESKHYLLPQVFPEIADRVFMCNSIGKSCSATGWRIGWCIHPPNWSNVYRGVHDQSVVMAPHPSQFATETYLRLPLSFFRATLPTRYKERLLELQKVLNEVGFKVSYPDGAYYLFALYRGVEKIKYLEPMEAAMFMTKEVGVACVPGDNFYGLAIEEGKRYLRFAACRSNHDIESACEKIKALVDKNEKSI